MVGIFLCVRGGEFGRVAQRDRRVACATQDGLIWRLEGAGRLGEDAGI